MNFQNFTMKNLKKTLNFTIWKLKVINFTIWKINILQFEKIIKLCKKFMNNEKINSKMKLLNFR